MLRLTLVLCLLCCLLASDAAFSDSITIGSVDAIAGSTVEIPVQISAAQEIIGIHMRLVFDPAIFLSPSVRKGILLASNHLLEAFSPAEGELNLTAYAPKSAPPFIGQNGTVAVIQMRIASNAASGSYPISFAPTAGGALPLPPTGLAGLGGAPIPHTSQSGMAHITGAAPGDLDGNQVLNGLDLLLFSAWWREAVDGSNSAANLAPGIQGEQIDARDLLALLRYMIQP